MTDYLAERAYQEVRDARSAVVNDCEEKALAAHEAGDEATAQHWLAEGRRIRRICPNLDADLRTRAPEVT